MKQLHRQVLFVADSPSPKNISEDVPLVGTKSYDTFLSWLARMQLDVRQVNFVNRTDRDAEAMVSTYMAHGYAIVALGTNAADFLDRCRAKYVRLPHPSGLNRQNNDKEVLKTKLFSAKCYIYAPVSPTLNKLYKRDG